MNFWVTIKKKEKEKKELNERGKKRLNAKLECHLAGPHALSHEVFESHVRETFCNNFYSAIFLQFFFFFLLVP